MSDAEDVLLHAAEHVAVATRALWRRQGDPREAAAARRARAERRLATWLAAAGGAPLALVPEDAPPAPGWLARALGRPAPWQERPEAVGWCDDARLALPRARLEGEGAEDAERLLLIALALVRRARRGGGAAPPASPLERDVRFVLDGALGDAELAAAFPGLAPALDAARGAARAARPPLARLAPAERAVEELVRALLEGAAHEAEHAARRAGVADATPESVERAARAWCARLAPLARGYRGMAPVEHWGAPAPPGVPAPAAAREAPIPAAGARRPASRRLPRTVRRRRLEPGEGDGRSGPFLVPHGDPHLAVQDPAGVVRPRDRGTDEDLDALADELARAGTLPTVRDAGAVAEVLEPEGPRAGRGGDAPAARVAAGTGPVAYRYPEWDAQRGAYRDPGIVLRETLLSSADSAWAEEAARRHRQLLARLRRQFEALRPRRERVGRQLEGDLLDLDGIAAEHAARRAGFGPDGRIYPRERSRRRDVAVLLLIDASGSTDAWVARGERVIDVARAAALCLGEALAALGDRFAIAAFSGRGPGDVRFGVAKRFAEPWSDAVRARIGALQPDRATRLGGPIRHASARLARQPARARLLIVLSDGKPDDDDAYEGRYGLEDVRQAVFEARRVGVRPFCVTIDCAGAHYLPHLFGPHGYTLLWDVQQLPERLPALYRRLVGV